MGWDNRKNGSKRRNIWDEENRLRQVRGPQGITQFAYDQTGQRTVKLGRQGETVYVNQFYVVRDGAIVTKHVFAGTGRAASKLQPGTVPSRGGGGGQGGGPGGGGPGGGGGPPSLPPGQGGELPPGLEKKDDLPPGQGGVNPGLGRERRSERAQERAQDVYKNPTLTGEKPGQRKGQQARGPQAPAAPAEVRGQRAFTGELPGEFLYFYHPDHLGSTSYVTDDKGAIYEHLQYFPFGETWVQEGQPSNRIPYLYTSKELDAETNLYYFGARYYDPRTSVWVSADPAFGKFLPNLRDRIRAARQRRTFRPEQELPGLGGVYKSVNLGVYGLAGQNPIIFVDPDGRMRRRPSDRRSDPPTESGGGGGGGIGPITLAEVGAAIKSIFSDIGDAIINLFTPTPDVVKQVKEKGPEALKDVGEQGKSKDIRVVTGTVSDAKALFDELRGKNKAKEVKPGVFVAKGKGGGTVTFRPESRSGPPTVDLNRVVEGVRKIKFVKSDDQ